MKRLRIALVTGLILLTFGAALGIERTRIVRTGETKLGARAAGRDVQVSIRTQVRRAKLYPGEDDSTAPRRSVVEAIEIVVNGKPVIVPASVSFRLIIPIEAELRLGKVVSVLTITGGDTSEAWVVQIEFDSERVRQKRVFSAVIPEKPLEVTTYYVVTMPEGDWPAERK
jgi:hypothetical protein